MPGPLNGQAGAGGGNECTPARRAWAPGICYHFCMECFTRRIRGTAWLGLWLLVLSACLPTLAQAVVRGERGDWVEICTSTGMVRIATGDAPAGEPSEPPPMTMAACDWCQWHAGVADLPPRSVDVWGWAPPPAGAPVLASRDAVLARPWASAQSRAPPLLRA